MNFTDAFPLGPPKPLDATTIDAIKCEGQAAKRFSLGRGACPRFVHDGMRVAWLEGYDAEPDPEPMLAKRFESGGALLGSFDDISQDPLIGN